MARFTRNSTLAFMVFAAAAACGLAVANDLWLLRVTEILIWILFAASLSFLVSFGGMVSFGHAAYFGIGAYGFALACKAGLPVAVSTVIGPLAATLAAAVFGVLCVRLTRIYFAMLTLACAEITFTVITQWYDLTGGDTGMVQFAPPVLGLGQRGFALLALVCTLAGLWVMRVALDAPFGLVMRSVGENPARAAALGFNTRRIQWAAFTLSGCMAGIAGMLYSAFQGNAFPDYAGMRFSLDALVMVMLGGVGSFAGPIVGAVTEKLLSSFLSHYVTQWQLVMGLILIGITVFSPHGVWGLIRNLAPARPSVVNE